MDEKILKIVAGKLRHYEGQPISQERLEAIRSAVYSATKTNKFASFSNVKKWIKAARGMMKRQDNQAKKAAKKVGKAKPSHHVLHAHFAPVREVAIPEVSRKVEDSVNLIKEEAAPVPPMQEVALPKPQIVFDKIYLQSIKFEIAGIRQTMERVSRQLDKMERELTSHAED